MKTLFDRQHASRHRAGRHHIGGHHTGRHHIGRLLFVLVLALLLGACDEILNTDALVREAILDAYPDLGSFELVEIDDGPILGQLTDLAASGLQVPLYIDLPVLTATDRIASYTWTVYPHDVRAADQTPILAFDPENEEGSPIELLTGPSMTFQGVPILDADAHLALIEQALAENLTYDEASYQPSVLNIVGGQLEGAYYGPEAETPYVIQGIRSLLATALEPAALDVLLAGSRKNYLIYHHAGYQPGLEHITEEVTPTQETDHHDADTVQPQAHAFTDGIKYVRMVPVADDTIYDPDTGSWLFGKSDWIDRMEAAANRASLFWTFAQVAADIPASSSDLATDNNRMLLRMLIPEYRVLTENGKALLTPHASSGCGGTGTFRDDIRSISNSTLRYDNEFWLWSTQDDFTGGGCAYSQTLGLSPRGTTDCSFIDGRNYPACGSVGYIELRSGHTTDWTSLVVIHEAGHALNGRHDNDTSGNTGETFNNHTCRFLGIFEFGPSGPSIMSYASGTQTFCFAATPSGGSPTKNLTLIAEHLHGVLK